ncbi:MAG TPA: energy transducer TonB [Xanthomonadaceae bacterium]|nr:energy transducer TonB [Xanthomonadaceae bacterium]
MSSMPPASSDLPPPSRRHDWLPSRRGLLFTALAFVAGLVLFAVVWRTQSRSDFYTVEPVAGPSAAQEFDPLPTPLPANRDRGASGMGERDREAGDPDERTADEPTRRPPEPVAPIELPPAPLPPPAPVAATQPPEPIPGQTPPPNYPRRALRRGIEGTVLVRVDVGPDGVPTSVGISQSSRSRELDRAAIEAVERWRFRPAMADGQPTVGTVVVPIDFNARR